MDENKEEIQISGTVDAVLYTNEENGFAIFRMRTSDLEDTELVTVTGCLPMAVPGEDVIIFGQWVNHPVYGKQIKAISSERQMPSSANVIYEFLAGGAIKGIGPSTAALIVNRFGAKSLDIIENHPEQLAKIRGISEQKAASFSESFHRQMLLRRLLEFLCANNVRPIIAMRLYKYYGENSADVIRTNPYIIAAAHIGGRFDEADSLAFNIGFLQNSPERIAAAAIFELRYNLNNGHSFIPREDLIAATARLIRIEPDAVAVSVNNLIGRREIVSETIGPVEACYLPEIYEAETYAAQRLSDMAKRKETLTGDTEQIISEVEKNTGLIYSEEQKQILRLVLENNIVAVTGGPGTGKTYSLSAVLEMLDAAGVKTCLAAPTGRAAKRISELTGRDAMTVHRLLGAKSSDDGEHTVFAKNADDQLDCRAVILDECSMIDIVLFSALLHAIPEKARLILVGDADQLPPVGPGKVFSSVIECGCIPMVRLTTIFRQAEGSQIVENAHRINRGEHPDLGRNKGDFFRLKRLEAASSVETVCELCATRLPEKMHIPQENIQVVSLSRKGDMGVVNLNRELQKVLNPPEETKKEKNFGEVIFREGDRIMQIRNDYDILWHDANYTVSGTGMFNGDTGYIRQIDMQNETITLDFDGKIASYTFDMLGEIEHSWAVTVHKSQGSEFPTVILVLSNQSKMLMTRRMLYTAVTRAKELLILVGSDQEAYAMIDNDKQSRRYSFLTTRIRRCIAKLEK